MAEEDTDIVVAIEGDETAATTKADEAPKKAASDDPVESLKSQFSQLRNEVSQSQQRANQVTTQASEEVARAREEVVQSRADAIEAGLSAAKTEADSAQAEYQAAFEAGDAARAAQAQRKLAAAVAKQGRLEEAKADVAVLKEAKGGEVRRAQPTEAPQRTAPADPVEAYVQGRPPQTAEWLRNHREYVTDGRKNAKLTAAHYSALGDGIEPNTPDYFDYIERQLGMKTDGEGSKDTKTNGQQHQRRPSAPALPVTESGRGTGAGGTEVRLTKGEAAAAQDGTLVWNYDDPKGKFKKGQPIGVQEMARRKLAMQREGRYSSTYYEE